MAVIGAFGEPATVLRREPSPGRDDYGNAIPGADTETVVLGCALAPGSSSEQNQFQDVLTVDAELYMPPGTDITATDRIRFREQTYTVEGEPARYRSPLTGTQGPVVVHLRKVS